MQGRADEAIYARRNAAVENERMIKESELNTEIAVEQKKRQIRETQLAAEIAAEQQKREIRETQMAAEISVEEKRLQLVSRRVENDRKEADVRAYALTEILKPLRDLDWKALMMLGGRGADPKAMIAMAFQEMAENAQKIGELNVSPDLLKSLIGDRTQGNSHVQEAGYRNPQNSVAGTGGALQHAVAGQVLHRACGRRLRRLRARGRCLPLRARDAPPGPGFRDAAATGGPEPGSDVSFSDGRIVVTLGQDGLVANTAKYVGSPADRRRESRAGPVRRHPAAFPAGPGATRRLSR